MNILKWALRFCGIWVGVWVAFVAVPVLVLLYFYPREVPLAVAIPFWAYAYVAVLPATVAAVKRGGEF